MCEAPTATQQQKKLQPDGGYCALFWRNWSPFYSSVAMQPTWDIDFPPSTPTQRQKHALHKFLGDAKIIQELTRDEAQRLLSLLVEISHNHSSDDAE